MDRERSFQAIQGHKILSALLSYEMKGQELYVMFLAWDEATCRRLGGSSSNAV